MQLRHIVATAEGRLDITDVAEKRKIDEKEKYCEGRQWGFMAFAMNSLSGFGSTMYQHFSTGFKEKREEAVRNGEPEWRIILEMKQLFEDISSAIQRRNYQMFADHAVDALPAAPEPPDVDPGAQHPC